MPKKIDNVDGRPAIETDKPMSIQEANEWALKVRAKADPKKDAIQKLRCAAAKRRERGSGNPTKTKDSEINYKAKSFNPESDAFDIDSSDGKKLLGKSISNGNVKNGQKVRSFFTPNGQVVIDVKPKGREIVLPTPEPKAPAKNPDIWPVTSCFLYSRIKSVKEKLTGNGAAQGKEETSWDAIKIYSGVNFSDYAYGFAERLDLLGDYETAEDALNNKLKPSRLIVPTGGGSSGAARDDSVINSGSADAVIVWFYIGSTNGYGTELVNEGSGKIFKVSGPSSYPSNQNTEQGPGFCMECYRAGVSVAIYPIVNLGEEPLTQYLSTSFPDLGGKIGYWGNIYSWHGMTDYSEGLSRRTYLYREYWSGIGGVPAYPTEQVQSPTSFPPEWQQGVSNYSPWALEDAQWYRFGWDYPSNRIACMSAGAIAVNTSALTAASVECGATIPNDQWYWVGGIGSSAGALDKRNSYSLADGMFVCWQGHKEHIGTAKSFFEAFATYWEIPGATVTKLGSCNLYGCEIPGGGGGYPAAPPSDASRFLIDTYGRKAKVFLVCHKQDYEPVEVELPFEYAAVVEEMTVLGGGSFSFGANFEASKTKKSLLTYGYQTGATGYEPIGLDLIHGTLSIDAEFAYINLFYGGERLYEEPMLFPLQTRLAAEGFGSPRTGNGGNYGYDRFTNRQMGTSPMSYGLSIYPSGYILSPSQTGEKHPRFIKDCWTSCLAIKVKLPTKNNKTLTIIETQKYKRGETITLTASNPDNEFDNKFLIRDYRTDFDIYGVEMVSIQNPEFASFGGLPALGLQFFLNNGYANNNIPITGNFYKKKEDFTILDWVYYQLQEMPRQYNPLITVLPTGVSIAQNGAAKVNVIYDLDKKFGRHGRAEKIMTASSFGYTTGNYYGGLSPTYASQGTLGPEHLFIAHKEQLAGNGLKVNNILTKWFRVTTSSFPIFGQLVRNES